MLSFVQMPERLSKAEFVTLMALMVSFIAFAIDSMLPAFPQISLDFSIQAAEDIQWIIAALFLGFGLGQLVFGPLSDVFGRKPPIYWGIAVFMMGSILAGLANSFPLFILGRFLQGFGGAGPRIVSMALIRDQYSGNAMAQIMSMIMTIFILIPAIAPSLGQTVLWFTSWRAIFIILFLVGLFVWIWFALRQRETLPKEKQKKLTFSQFKYGSSETFSQPTTVACMIVSGLIFGIFVGYLGAVQEIFDKVFNVAKYFPLLFATLAISIGGASFFNSRLVMVLGMRRLIFSAFAFMCILSNLFAAYLYFIQVGSPPLWLFMVYMILNFFSVGFLFGNLNSLAMQPLGHVAGIGSAILGFFQSTISVIVGVQLGHYFHNGVTPLVLSFGVMSLLCMLILRFEMTFKGSVGSIKPSSSGIE